MTAVWVVLVVLLAPLYLALAVAAAVVGFVWGLSAGDES